MKKIVLTENQVQMVKKHVTESAVGNERYGREVSVSVGTYGAKINGEDIDWAVCSDMKVSYLIEMEHRSWGIKGISLYSIQGPSEIELTITPQVEDADDIDITVQLNWENVEEETQEGEGVITIGNEIDSIETYPASEGFIAYQDTQEEAGLLLNVDSGIFFQFVPLSEVHSKSPTRLRLHDVELDKQYAIVLSSNAGLWSYVIGDTVKFISKTPYRILVTGRIKHFISAFGEHVIAEEVDEVIAKVSKEMNTSITEFTVAPEVNPINELPYHEWFIEFDKSPTDINLFRHRLDELLQKKNIYYRDLIEGKILQTLKISELKKDSFINFMRDQGKLGGQNKLPRLKNDRSIADELVTFKK